MALEMKLFSQLYPVVSKNELWLIYHELITSLLQVTVSYCLKKLGPAMCVELAVASEKLLGMIFIENMAL